MKFTDIRKWAKEQGFIVRKQEDDSINGASYYWNKNDDSISGVSISVSKLARDIYNIISDNKWLDHQNTYANRTDYNNS